MRKLILAILLILCMCVYASADTTVVCVQGVGGCTTSNDSALATSGWAADDGSNTSTTVCSQVTLSATDDITEYDFGFCDSDTDSSTFTAALYVDDTNEPSGTSATDYIAGTNLAKAGSAVVNCGDDAAVQTFTLAATKVDIGVTTAWLCVTSSGGSSTLAASYDSIAAGGIICYGSFPSSWTCWTNTYEFSSEVRGCN